MTDDDLAALTALDKAILKLEDVIFAFRFRLSLGGKLLVIAVLILAIVLMVIVGSGGSSTSDSGQQVPSTAASLDRTGTCALEVVSEAGVLRTGDSGVWQVDDAIGILNAQFPLASLTEGAMNLEIQRAGVSEALPAVAAKARSLCAQHGDPLLTVGQVESLKLIVPPANAAAMSAIHLFA